MTKMHLTYSIVTGSFYRIRKDEYTLLGVELPEQVDHINDDKTCNAWHNLLEAALARDNLQQAWKRVQANKNSCVVEQGLREELHGQYANHT